MVKSSKAKLDLRKMCARLIFRNFVYPPIYTRGKQNLYLYNLIASVINALIILDIELPSINPKYD